MSIRVVRILIYTGDEEQIKEDLALRWVKDKREVAKYRIEESLNFLGEEPREEKKNA